MEKYYLNLIWLLTPAEREVMYDALAQDNTLSDARTRLFLGLIELRKSQLKRLKESNEFQQGKSNEGYIGRIYKAFSRRFGNRIFVSNFLQRNLKRSGTNCLAD